MLLADCATLATALLTGAAVVPITIDHHRTSEHSAPNQNEYSEHGDGKQSPLRERGISRA